MTWGVQRQILSCLFFYYLHNRFPLDPSAYPQPPMDSVKATVADAAVKTVDTLTTKPDETQLDPPKDTPFTKAELAKYDGKDKDTPIYVAIKGKIYDGQSNHPTPPRLARLLHFAENPLSPSRL